MQIKLLPQVLLLISTIPLFAQGERATVTGTVSDSSGAIVPGANVAIRNIGTNVTARTATKLRRPLFHPGAAPG